MRANVRLPQLGLALCLLLTCLRPVSASEEALLLLKNECFRCHTDEKRKGGLIMTDRDALLAGGDSGLAALAPGNPADSFLLETLDADADPHMPPKEQLSAEQIASVRGWIEAGAPWDAELLMAEAEPTGPETLSDLPPGYQPVTTMALSPDESLLAVGRGSRIDVFAIPQAEEGKDETPAAPKFLRSLQGHQDAVQSLAWHPEGPLLVSGGYRRLCVWELQQDTPRFTLTEGLEGRITALCFSQGNQLVVADSRPARPSHLHLVDAKQWRIQTSFLEAHSDAIYDLALSGDGKHFASASADKLVKLWDLQLGGATVLETHTGYVQTLAFSPQSDRLASAGEDLAIKVWNLDTRKVIHSFTDRKPTGSVTDIIWDVDPAQKDPKAEAKDWLIAVTEDGIPRQYTDFVVHDGTQRSGEAKMRAFAAAEEPVVLSRLVWLSKRKQLIYGDIHGALWLRDSTGKDLGSLD